MLHYRLDFSIDFNIIEIGELKKSEINNVAMMVDFDYNTNLNKNGLTLKIKVNHQSQVIENEFFNISLTFKMLESTPRSTSYHVYNRR